MFRRTLRHCATLSRSHTLLLRDGRWLTLHSPGETGLVLESSLVDNHQLRQLTGVALAGEHTPYWQTLQLLDGQPELRESLAEAVRDLSRDLRREREQREQQARFREELRLLTFVLSMVGFTIALKRS